MQMGIGLLELAVAAIAGIISLPMFMMRLQGLRWMNAIFGWTSLAIRVTPADIFSAWLMTPAFLVAYFFGSRQSGLRRIAVQ